MQREDALISAPLAVLSVFFLSQLAACAGPQAPAPAAPSGREVFLAACTRCHDVGGVEAFKGYWDEPKWRDMVQTMIEHGAAVPPAQVDVLVDYLVSAYGPDAP